MAISLLLVLTIGVDPGGYLGTDTGGKVATLDAMVDDGSWTPDVGYWAEDLDPTGEYHPLFGTRRSGDSWIQVTTLPMIYAARPLYESGGYRLALLIPILGSVGAALAARALAARLRCARPDLVFWLFVLGSPLLVYALDLWEHSVGVALMSWAFVILLDLVERRRRPWTALAAGALLAAAASMRTEALVYTFVMVAVTAGTLVMGRRLREAVVTGASAVLGFVPVWLANSWLENRFDAPSRSGRARGAAESGLTDSAGGAMVRIEEGLETLLSVRADGTVASVLIGAVLLVLIGGLVRWSGRVPRRILVGGTAFVVGVYLLLFASGLGFVNGLIAAFPVAAAAIGFDHRDRTQTMMVGVAVAALPLVWAFQFIGGAGPQWGGRYILESGFLLGVVGAAALGRREVPPVLPRVVVGTCVAVSVFGLVWLFDRSHDVADGFDRIESVQVDGLVARNPFILREGGPAFADERWLSAPRRDGGRVDGPISLFRDAGARRVGVLQQVDGPIEDLGVIEVVPLELLDTAFEIVVYDLG